VTDPQDPGWRTLTTRGSPPLARLRLSFTIFVLALLGYLVFLSFATDFEDPWRAELERDWTLWILVAGVAASLVGVGWARGRPPSATTLQALSGSYATRFFVGIALAESAALLGFILVFVANRLWPYLVGLVVSLAGFAMMAPTGRNIERDEEHLRAAGAPVSLWDALTQPPHRSARGAP
jgi:uncharacterized membrane protein YfcA